MPAATCLGQDSYRVLTPTLALVREGPPPGAPPPAGMRLLDQVRAAIRLRHYSRRTEKAYAGWVRRFILFHGKRHPAEMGKAEVARFLSHLAVEARVSASTQNQALSALLFLYGQVLNQEPGWLDEIVRAKRPGRLPVVLSRQEVRALLRSLTGVEALMAALLYGAGLRLLECCRLRVKDVDFSRGEILVRDGKGARDRVTLLPAAVATPLAAHLRRMRVQHERDLREGLGSVELPLALERKYPRAAFEWGWQWVFPAARICTDPRFGPPTRYHLHESAVQKAVHGAARRAGLVRRRGAWFAPRHDGGRGRRRYAYHAPWDSRQWTKL